VDEQGYALLIAASPGGRYPALDAGEALPALAAATPSALLGTRTGNVVQLAEPGDPHTVLAQLRTAAAHDGPLLVYVAGQLGLDPRQRLPHLALSKSTPRSVRYTGLPWHWLAAELAGRTGGPERTAVLADLVADPALWECRGEQRLADGLTLYGTLAPPPAKRRPASLGYSRALAEALRAVHVRPPLAELHRHCVRGGELAPGSELFGGATDEPAGVPGGLAVPGGFSAVPGFDGPSGAGGFTGAYGSAAAPPPWWPGGPPEGAASPESAAASPAPAAKPELEPGPGRQSAPGMEQEPGRDERPLPALPAPAEQSSAAPPAPAETSGGRDQDPHTAIYQAVAEGRHGEAATIAAEWETAALRTSGPASREAVHWVEVRADLAHQAGDAERSCTLWLHAAGARLRAGQSPHDPEVFGAVDRAHHCWHKVTDAESAQELGVQLAELRQRAPGRQPGALEDVRTRLATLANGAAQHTG